MKATLPVATPFATLSAAGSYRVTFTVQPWSPGGAPKTLDLTIGP